MSFPNLNPIPALQAIAGSSTLTAYNSIPYWELGDYKELDRLDGNESTRELITPWSTRLKFKQAMLGDASLTPFVPAVGPPDPITGLPTASSGPDVPKFGGNDGLIFRILPEVHPEMPWQRCINLEMMPNGRLSMDQASRLIHPIDDADPGKFAAAVGGKQGLRDGFAHYLATYASVPYNFTSTDANARAFKRETNRFVDFTSAYHVENLPVPGNTFKFSDGVFILEAGAIPFPHTEWTIFWTAVPAVNYSNIGGLLGKINSIDFVLPRDALKSSKTFAKDTALFLGFAQSKFYSSPSGQMLCDLELKVAERTGPAGATWAMLPRRRSLIGFQFGLHFEAATDAAGNPPFIRADLNSIFTMPT